MKNPSKPSHSPRPTLAIVAKEAGVSKETVSHILGAKGERYHEDTRKRVFAAAERLNYRPHRAAQIMRGARSRLIGIIHFGVANQNAYRAAHYLPQEIQAAGYDVLVVDLSWHGGNRKRALDILVESRVEGVIITQMVESFTKEDIEAITGAGIPTVSIAGNEELGIPSVFANSGTAFRDLVSHLLAQGRRKLLFLGNTYQARPTRSRLAGFREGIEAAGGMIVERPSDFKKYGCDQVCGAMVRIADRHSPLDPGSSPYHYTRQLIEHGLLPDAILATNDLWAQAVFAAALEGGIRIPQDLAVTGFDDAPFAAHAPYYLTTAAPNVAEESRKVVEILMELIAGRALPQQHYIFPCQMIVRRSCGAVMSEPLLPPSQPALPL